MEGSGGKMVRNYKRKTEDRWTKEDLLNALMCIKNNELKINDAARTFGISRATLYRQYAKFIQGGAKCDVNQFRTCGGNPILTKVEEDVLEKTITDLRAQGFTVGSTDIKRICFEYCDSNGIPNQFNSEKRTASDDWYYGFLKRHPSVGRVKSNTNADGTPDDLVLKPKIKRRPLKTKGEGSPTKRNSNKDTSVVKKNSKGSKRPRKIKTEPEGETVIFENIEEIAKTEYVMSDTLAAGEESPEMILGDHDEENDDIADGEVENDEEASEDEHSEENDVDADEEEVNGVENDEDDEEVENGLPTFEENEIDENGEVEDDADNDEGTDESVEENDELEEEKDDEAEVGSLNEDEAEEEGEAEDADDVEAENEDEEEDEVEAENEDEVEAENEDEAEAEDEDEVEPEEEVENDEEAADDVENECEAEEEVDNEEIVPDNDDDEATQKIEEEDEEEEEEEEEEDEIDEEATQVIKQEVEVEIEVVKEDTKKKRSRRPPVEKPVEEVEPKRVTPSRSRKRPARYESLSRSSTPTLPTPKGRGSRRSAPSVTVAEKVNGDTPSKRRRSRKNFS